MTTIKNSDVSVLSHSLGLAPLTLMTSRRRERPAAPARQTCIDSLKRYSAMDKTITIDQLATTDLRSINEIWLGGTHTELCLWRGEQIFTHDMLSEGTHDQNVRRLCLQLVDPDDQAAVASVEVIVRERLEKMGSEGEFYPAENVDTHQ
ncbi:hypothetical protein ALO95_02148 [Pseudomonas syringae pv. antirrhini]|nr:hypothetical protein ALO95_02148 [Pseudomonas syringae pv. antirrhini]